MLGDCSRASTVHGKNHGVRRIRLESFTLATHLARLRIDGAEHEEKSSWRVKRRRELLNPSRRCPLSCGTEGLDRTWRVEDRAGPVDAALIVAARGNRNGIGECENGQL
jgi:hypothetical protein